MSWAGLANNQTVSFSNLQNAINTNVFQAKTPIPSPSSTEQITKSQANTYANITTTYAPYAAKTASQLVVKSDLKIGSNGFIQFTSLGTRTVVLNIISNSVNLSVGLFENTFSCVTTSKTTIVDPTTTTSITAEIVFSGSGLFEVYDYVFRILDNETRSTSYDTDSGDAEVGPTGATYSYIATVPSVGVGYYYELIITSRSC